MSCKMIFLLIIGGVFVTEWLILLVFMATEKIREADKKYREDDTQEGGEEHAKKRRQKEPG